VLTGKTICGVVAGETGAAGSGMGGAVSCGGCGIRTGGVEAGGESPDSRQPVGRQPCLGAGAFNVAAGSEVCCREERGGMAPRLGRRRRWRRGMGAVVCGRAVVAAGWNWRLRRPSRFIGEPVMAEVEAAAEMTWTELARSWP